MTIERTRELLPVIMAYSEGKIIECRSMYSESNWTEINESSWLDDMEYRIKPEKKFISFTYEDRNLFLGKVVKNKNSSVSTIIIGCSNTVIMFLNNNWSYNEALESLVFEDGSPFGKLNYD